MTVTPQVTADGLTVRTVTDCRDNLRARFEASPEFGPTIATGPYSVAGLIIDAVAPEIQEGDAALEEVWDMTDPDAAEGVAQDNLCGISGVERDDEDHSTVTLTCGGTPTTVITAGKKAKIPNGEEWETLEDGTIGGGGTVDIPAQAVNAGPIDAAAASITEIVTAVTGWDTVTNASAAVPGAYVETDTALRARREQSLDEGGTARARAIRANVEALDCVEAAACLENTGLETDGDGIPGKSIRVIVWPTGLSTTEEQEVIDAIWEVIAGGIYSDGTEEYTVTDDMGCEQTLRFSYGTAVEIYIEITVTATDDYPSDGDAQIAALLKVIDNDYSLGEVVKPVELATAIMDEIPGIDHLAIKLKAGGAPGAGDTVPLYMDTDEVPYFDSNITVIS